MTHERIEGGYVLLPRVLFNHDICTMPLYYRWIWLYLIMKASFSIKKTGDRLDRGQVLVTLDELAQACSYYVGYRRIAISRKDAWRTCEWLREGDKIGTTKTTRGLIVTILNYDRYQNPANYERDNEEPNERDNDATMTRQQRNTIDKKVKKEKKGKKTTQMLLPVDPDPFFGNPLPASLNTPALHESWAEWVQHRKEIKEPLTPTSVKRQLKKLEGLGPETACHWIGNAIEKGWRGIYPPTDSTAGGNGTGHATIPAGQAVCDRVFGKRATP